MSSISTKIYSKCDLSICDYDLDPTYSLSNDAISDCMDYQSKCNFVLKDKLKYTINNNTTDVDKYYNNTVEFTISCSRGTYIRSIARDFALKLDTLGYLTKLQRTRIGDFNINNVINIENFEEWLFINH